MHDSLERLGEDWRDAVVFQAGAPFQKALLISFRLMNPMQKRMMKGSRGGLLMQIGLPR